MPRVAGFTACCRALMLAMVATAPLFAADEVLFSREPVRDEFRAAWRDATEAHALGADGPRLRAYLLYPYVQMARLRAALDSMPANRRDAVVEARVREFLAAHDELPVSWDLERDWLRYLGRREAWAEFLREAPAELNDPELQCFELDARLHSGRLGGLARDARVLWLTLASSPPACRPVFDWLDQPGRADPDTVAERARAAATRRQPLPRTISTLPAERRAVLRFQHTLYGAMSRGLRRFLDGQNLAAPDPAPPGDAIAGALLHAFERVARRDSTQARPLFERLHAHAAIGPIGRVRLRRDYAVGLALDRDAEALAQFREVPLEALDDEAHEWRVRSALFQRQWTQAQRWIGEMPAALRDEVRWRYWRARLLERDGNREAARRTYAGLAREREYYAFLAAERLGRTPDLRPRRLRADEAAAGRIASLPGMQRARELFHCGLQDLAAREFRTALDGVNPEQRFHAIRVAHGWQWHHQAILLQAELKLWDDLWVRAPAPWPDVVRDAARQAELPADRVLSLIRTESLYNAWARSGADARGLMQLLPSTARKVSRELGSELSSTEDLYRPEVNILLGARYLRSMIDRFDGHYVLALAGYNAGPQRIPGWLPRRGDLDAEVWIENIPYNETRHYVQRALSNLVLVSWRLNESPTRLLPLMQPVTPAHTGS